MDPLTAVFILFGMLIVGYVFFMTTRRPAASKEDQDAVDANSTDLNAIAAALETPFEKMAHPGDALTNPLFERAVDLLCADDYSANQVMNYALGSNWVLQCAGFEALKRRGDSEEMLERARARLADTWAWPLYFALRYIDEKSSVPEIANILASAQEWWPGNPMLCEELGTVIRRRLENGEQLALGRRFHGLSPESRQHVQRFVAALPHDVRPRLEAAIAQYLRNAIDEPFLRSVGELLATRHINDPVFETKQISRLLEECAAEAADDRPRSILVVGESGVGKTALRREFARRLLGQGWRIFQTAAANIIADKVYIGEIEGQVRRLAENATVAKHVVVYVDRLDELDEFGRHKSKNSSILDQLWPMIESHEMFFVSETTPSGLQAMLRRFPSLPTAMKVVRMVPADEQAAAEMASALLDQGDIDVSESQKDEVVAEALQLSQQYLSHKALPGSVLSLVELSMIRAERTDDDHALNRMHVLGALSQVSGLPKEVLDERQTLDMDAVRDAFTRRIIGQDEAVECLVERIAMLKAGLTDPSRPVGVFLFAGPTGTGKTEIAKTLAEILFGSPEQMIRLDMSEYQNADSAWRLIDEGDSHGSKGSLATRIREQPFSVVLLDEFEKAHVNVWDMFLQVFDDGRLTDVKGGLADFRHSIIILTSNLGSTISNEAGIGFTSTRGDFSADDVMRAVNRTFRREFVNRLDRVVVFKPLGRDVMAAILRKELQLALGRRGLRTKQWAVEWEDSALEFLLDEGFTPDLGARPLRRAIEKHLLAPLSMTMVQNQTPDGEQFLFVRSNGEQLQVEFIDPDADDTSVASPETGDLAQDLTVPQVLEATSVPKGASALLTTEMGAIQARVASDE